MHHLRCSARRKGRQRERDLLAWVNGTHAAYMRSNGQRISPYQKRFLDELPFFRQTWPHRFDMTWDRSFSVLQQWGKDNEGLPVGPMECDYEADDRDTEYESVRYGWVQVGSFLQWSITAMLTQRKRLRKKT